MRDTIPRAVRIARVRVFIGSGSPRDRAVPARSVVGRPADSLQVVPSPALRFGQVRIKEEVEGGGSGSMHSTTDPSRRPECAMAQRTVYSGVIREPDRVPSDMKMSEFARRRRQMMRMMGNGSIAIVPAAPERLRNRDVEYPYRQDSDLHYLTGFPEPEAVVVFVPGRRHGEFMLFCRPRDPEREAWIGPRAGQEGAVDGFGADDSFPITDLDDILPGLLEGCERVFYTMGRARYHL